MFIKSKHEWITQYEINILIKRKGERENESETNSDLIEHQQDTLLNSKQKQTKFGNIKLRRWWFVDDVQATK